MIGDKLAHYRILAKLGEGGMGIVFLAEDERLHRKVALKTLPPALAEDPQRLARFEREVKTVAALNHPNIVTIYSVEEADGKRFFTMEHVEGKTLSQLIPPGGLPLKEFLKIAVPLADGRVFFMGGEDGGTYQRHRDAGIGVGEEKDGFAVGDQNPGRISAASRPVLGRDRHEAPRPEGGLGHRAGIATLPIATPSASRNSMVTGPRGSWKPSCPVAASPGPRSRLGSSGVAGGP